MQGGKQNNHNQVVENTDDCLNAAMSKVSSSDGSGKSLKTKKLSTVTRVVISLVLLTGIAYLIDLEDAWEIVKKSHVDLLILSIGVAFIGRLFSAFRWYLLVRNRNPGAKYSRIVRLIFVSSFLGMFLPGGVGVEAVRVYGLARSTSDISLALASVLVERVLALFVLMLLVLVGLIYAPTGILPDSLGVTAWVVLACLLAGSVGILNPVFRRIGDRILLLLNLRFLKDHLQHFYQALDVYKSQPHVIGWSIIAAFVSVVFRITPTVILAQALNIDISLAHFAIFLPIILFLTSLPFSIGGLGVRETAFIWLFGLVGVTNTAAFTLSLMIYALSILSSLPGGWFYARGGIAPRTP